MLPDGISALQISNLVKSKELSPVEVVLGVRDAVEERNPSINAVVALRVEKALEEARELEKRIQKGEEVGILCGVPMLVKDLEHVAGMPTTFGSPAFKENLVTLDSIQVMRLKSEGAIIIGKTNTPEFGFTGFTKNRLFGVTKNPWDLTKTPGGSSGGSAAAVTSGMVPLATGSDAGGSIRIPASYCGCVGLKPTFGRIPLGPDFMGFGSHIWTLGPLSRYVEDAWAYLLAVSGFHPSDPHSLLPRLELDRMPSRPPKRLRVLYSPNLGRFPVEGRVREQVERIVKYMEMCGHEVMELKEEFPDVERAWWIYMATDLAFQLGNTLKEKRSELNRAMVNTIEELLGLKLAELVSIRKARADLFFKTQQVFERADILMTPTTPTTAFGAEGPPPQCIEGSPVRLLDVVAFTYPFNLTGHPAISIRAGMTKEGLPVGVQFVAPLLREDMLLALAWELEQEFSLHKLWPY